MIKCCIYYPGDTILLNAIQRYNSDPKQFNSISEMFNYIKSVWNKHFTKRMYGSTYDIKVDLTFITIGIDQGGDDRVGFNASRELSMELFRIDDGKKSYNTDPSTVTMTIGYCDLGEKG